MTAIEKGYWTANEIYRLFKIKERFKSQRTLFYAEEKGTIPKADRVARGSVMVRQWRLDQLPEIGKQFGFLNAPQKKHIITIYAPKGGVLKTNFSYNFARMLALNGISVIVIGLDSAQESITTCALPPKKAESLEDIEEEIPGLYHYFVKKYPLEQIIRKTSLPTLDIIPENPELTRLEVDLRAMRRREYVFAEQLIDKLPYQVVLFDNGSGWNGLVENSLVAANSIVCPMGCSIEAYRAVNKNLSMLFDFEAAMKIQWEHFIQITTLLENTSMSDKIYKSYISEYGENVITKAIRHAVIGQEASAYHQSVIEYDPSSPLAQDYYSVVESIWTRLNS